MSKTDLERLSQLRTDVLRIVQLALEHSLVLASHLAVTQHALPVPFVVHASYSLVENAVVRKVPPVKTNQSRTSVASIRCVREFRLTDQLAALPWMGTSGRNFMKRAAMTCLSMEPSSSTRLRNYRTTNKTWWLDNILKMINLPCLLQAPKNLWARKTDSDFFELNLECDLGQQVLTPLGFRVEAQVRRQEDRVNHCNTHNTVSLSHIYLMRWKAV